MQRWLLKLFVEMEELVVLEWVVLEERRSVYRPRND
jgi:hypothetical protein